MSEQTTTQATHTPGPWAWRGSPKNGGIYLVSLTAGRPTVMAFPRQGFTNTFPSFNVDGFLKSARDLGVPEVSYRDNIIDIDHPDAHLIAAAPDLLAELNTLHPGHGRGHSLMPDVCTACAAIAKARPS